MRAWAIRLVTIAVLLGTLLGCLQEQRYHVVDAAVEMTADTPVFFVTEDDDEVFRVDAPFSLRITPPSERALAALSEPPATDYAPFVRRPWVMRDDLTLQLDYAVENRAMDPVVVTVTLNGINEFHYYAPGPENFHQWERRVSLAPGERVHGTLTGLELDEIAVDLATVVNGAPNSNLVVDARSQSDRDPRVAPYIPKLVPGLVGVRAGLETNRALPLRLELTIRGSDHHDRAAKRGERAWTLPEPQPFTPIVPDIE